MTRSSPLVRRTIRRVPRAEELAGYESRFSKIETDLAVLKWMVGLNLAASLSLVIKAFV
jgi:hypothetical protein